MKSALDKKELAKQLVARGFSLRFLARFFKVSYQTIANWARAD